DYIRLYACRDDAPSSRNRNDARGVTDQLIPSADHNHNRSTVCSWFNLKHNHPCCESIFRKKLRRGAKLQMIWKMQKVALYFVIAALQKIRETSNRLPRASRLSIERLQFVAPNKADLLAPIRERVRICTKCQ